MRPDQEESVRKMREEWEFRVFPSPETLDWFLDVKDYLVKLRVIGFAVASCSWCSVTRPRAEEARCPVCDCLVSREGRRRFQRPAMFGISIPDEGVDQARWDELRDRATETRLDLLAGALASATSRGPKN